MVERDILIAKTATIKRCLATKMEGVRRTTLFDYDSLDPDILKSILVNGLRDLEEFYATVLAYFEGTKTQDNR